MPALAIARQPLSSHCLFHFSSSTACLDSEARRSGLLSPSNLSPCLLQKQVACGLSCSLSSPSFRLGVEWLDKSDRIDSQLASSIICQGSISCSSNAKILAVSSSLPSVRAGKERLFDRFIANATGSCLDYDSTGYPVLEGGATVNANTPFVTLEKNLDKLVPQYDLYVQKLLARAQSAHKIFSDEFVMKAFFEAEKAHKGQMRMSGDPYLQHCMETAMLLAGLGANSTIVAAALLHDAIDDSFMTYEYVVREFGTSVADLVKGVSKLSHLSKLARMNDIASRSVEANRLHTIFLAMLDARAVFIKLADRLHNMMTLEHLPMFKQRRFAKETLEIFVPLANRLGILSWKEKLENLCFKHLYPEQHEMLASKLLRSFDEAVIVSTMNKLDQALRNEGVPNHVLSGRFKSFYSIYRKMLKNNQHMDKIHDIHGLRLILNNEQECYLALDIVHRLLPKVPGRFKDYIEHPKFNGYQSLHTVVLSEGELPLEIQIRSRQMHLQAEYGFAAHWRYKESNCHHSSFILQMVEWARWVISWQCEDMNLHHSSCIGDEEEDEDSIRPPSQNPSETHTCPYSYCCLSNNSGPLYIIMMENEKMLVHEFPANTTVKDLLETIGRVNEQWPSYGFTVKEELRPRLNGVPITDPGQKLRMGDVIELTPAIPDESLPECREEIQRMYDGDFSILSQDGGRN